MARANYPLMGTCGCAMDLIPAVRSGGGWIYMGRNCPHMTALKAAGKYEGPEEEGEHDE